MRALTWFYVLPLFSLIGSSISVAACSIYAKHAATRASFTLLVGAVGLLLTSALSDASGFVIRYRMSHLPVGGGTARIGELLTLSTNLDIGVIVVSLVFGLMFSISLFLVLRDAALRLGDGSTAQNSDATPPSIDEQPPA
jgi:hypothetical protein